MTEFRKFSKIPRLRRSMLITEKIDGTNGQIFIGEDGEFLVGSRKRWITPEDDNFGFAAWAYERKHDLIHWLGPGRHFGEWWGQGIQRKYKMTEKVFSLFNVFRWYDQSWADPSEVEPNLAFLTEEEKTMLKPLPAFCDVVPILGRGDFGVQNAVHIMGQLEKVGSLAARRFGVIFERPEGVVVLHEPSRVLFKMTLENDEGGKEHGS